MRCPRRPVAPVTTTTVSRGAFMAGSQGVAGGEWLKSAAPHASGETSERKMVEWRWSSILPQIPNGGRQGAKRNLTTQPTASPQPNTGR